MRVVCYAQPDKRKSQIVLEAFAAGAGAMMAWTTAAELFPGAIPVFYGVRPSWKHLWDQARRENRDWFYIDNAYFDCARDQFYRVTKRAIQHTGKGVTSGSRFDALGLMVKAPRLRGGVTVACAQSAEFMGTVADDPAWLTRKVAAARQAGEQVLVRHKGEQRPLEQDLAAAKKLITWSSAAAVTAVLEGVAVDCSDRCCAHQVGADRRQWAGVLADNQWTLEEMASGKTWRRVR